MLLIPGSFLLLVTFHFITSDQSPGESILRSFLMVSGFTWIITEVLSLFNCIRYSSVFISWLSVVLIVIALLFWFSKKNPKVVKGRLGNLIGKISGFSWQEILLITAISIILILTLVIALFSPPNTFDSMTYHMARIVHWIQNHSVDFFPTSIARQNHSMPFSEYLILNVQILSQSDKYANLIQWAGYGILMISVSLITAQFHISRTGRLFAALLVATLPMAILQSSSTQNDLVTSVFCVSFAYFLLKVIKDGSWVDVVFAGLSFGMALLTKGTAYVFCAAIGLTIAIYGLVKKHKDGFKILFFRLTVIVLCGMIINSGFYARNYDLYSNPLSTETNRITIDRLSLKALYTNMIRNGSVHLAVPLPDINQRLSSLTATHLNAIDPGQEAVYQGTEFKIQYLINEDESGNFFHFILLTYALVFLLFSWKKNDPYLNIYTISVLFSIILFASMLKWQPWGTRLQLPIFSLGIPIIVYSVDRLRRSQAVILILFLSLTIYSLPYLFLNNSRPLVPLFSESSKFRSNKIKQFFSNRPDLYDQYKEIISPFYQDISVLHTDRQRMYFSSNKGLYQDYSSVMKIVNELDQEKLGLHLGENDWEYPIWVMSNRLDSEGLPGFIHVGVDNESRKLGGDPLIAPKYIITTMDHSDLSEKLHISYKTVIDTDSIDLLERSGSKD